jgi:hypothetical protein
MHQNTSLTEGPLPTRLRHLRLVKIVPVLSGVVVLAACASGSGTASAPAATVPGPATSAAAPATSAAAAAAATSAAAPAPSTAVAVAVAAPSPVDTTSLTCKDFDKAAPELVSSLHALAQYLGTDSDPAQNLGELATSMGVLSAMAPQCAPKAVDSLAAMSDAAAIVPGVYDTGKDPAVIEADKKALDDVQAAGLVAWKAMGWT